MNSTKIYDRLNFYISYTQPYYFFIVLLTVNRGNLKSSVNSI
jgi:hypothetical protein